MGLYDRVSSGLLANIDAQIKFEELTRRNIDEREPTETSEVKGAVRQAVQAVAEK